MSSNQSCNALRLKHPRFVYKQFSWTVDGNQLNCTWHFHTEPNIDFKPKLSIPLPDKINHWHNSTLDWLVFNIGLVESLSYWKATASPEIIVEAGSLTTEQITWWHNLILNGLGEYFYLNQIEFNQSDFVKITTSNHQPVAAAPIDLNFKPEETTYLIPIGGGKDSIVTLELLKLWQTTHPQTKLLTTTLNPTQTTKAVIKQSGLTEVFAQRVIDPKLLSLNQAGYLNGHTPFSALLAFVNLLIGYLYDCHHIVLSNEQSANEGNVQYQNKIINHQYSKSLEFETAFRQYISPVKLSDYFSVLRPISELQIARLFSKLGNQYLSIFKSCNKGQKTNTWCGECAKCLFAWTILFPFLGEEKMIGVFGQNLFKNAQLLQIALELIGQTQNKPFDCVGTYHESLIAFALSAKWYKKQNLELPALLHQLESQELLKSADTQSAEKLLSQWTDNHYLPKDLSNFLHQQVSD